MDRLKLPCEVKNIKVLRLTLISAVAGRFYGDKQRNGGDIIYQKRKMAFIGIDMHKDTHTAVVIDC